MEITKEKLQDLTEKVNYLIGKTLGKDAKFVYSMALACDEGLTVLKNCPEEIAVAIMETAVTLFRDNLPKEFENRYPGDKGIAPLEGN